MSSHPLGNGGSARLAVLIRLVVLAVAASALSIIALTSPGAPPS